VKEAELKELAHDVAAACGFGYVPSVRMRKGKGGTWNASTRRITIGNKSPPRYVWFVMAHELAHAQGRSDEKHKLSFWRRLAAGLSRAGKLELLRQDFHYKAGCLTVAREYGMADVPATQEFTFSVGDGALIKGRQWCVARRYRRMGAPWYLLECQDGGLRYFRWDLSEKQLLEHAI